MLQAINPATEELVREVQPFNQQQLHRAMEAAEGSFQRWRKTSFKERAQVLKAAASYMKEHCNELAPLMTEEMGKPIKEARGEVMKAAWCAEHYAEHAEQYLATEHIESDASRSYVQYLPLGPVLGILPWNAPFWLAFRFCAPTLMAGNTCLMKHDPHVPGCAAAIEKIFEAIDAPSGILQNLPLTRDDAEGAIRHPAVRGVSFTGSTRGGSAVAAVAASELKPAVLELGGSDPAVVLADASLETAADVITLSRIINAGQSCIAAKRIIVEASVYTQMVELLQSRLQQLTLGDPALETTDVGPLARPDLRDNLHRQVRESISSGARCLLGGEMPEYKGYFYPVTLLADVTNDMTASCEETFGPVASVIKAEDAEHALAIANDSEYGLGAAVWTSTERGEAMARELVTGQVAVNGIVKTDPRLPSGGVKRSGYGRELGPHGIREFVNAQQVWVGPKKG
ncbi:NAD-dependent succinate-semialdehyde dehydrogenase [Proteobacteria bacterium 005FR1]|nr:NAD-dependent succinate-semialdehyde dehydrogenase [Proteobacteria bacterium 005FR1]